MVAHPDDETLIGSYLARAIFDQHRRVAVVFGTRGGSGGDAAGDEQGAALQDVREIEARRALAHFGISDVWFLRGLDTPGQDVLDSLEHWNHGDQLDRLVRIVRLTRPAVIATWLPAVLMGEDHGDHQASGVLATEAFDLAGNPVAFPEQVAAPRDPNGMSNLTEGLQPWQPEKLYYFSDTAHPETLDGLGPRYDAQETSPSKHLSYARLSAEEGAEHLTQSDSGAFAAEALAGRVKAPTPLGYFDAPARFILGKSLVNGGPPVSDIFSGVIPDGIPYRAAPGYRAPAPPPSVTLALGGPWVFYSRFWPAHGLHMQPALETPEIYINFESPLTVPVRVENPTDAPVTLPIAVQTPRDWIYWRHPPAEITVPARSEKTFSFEIRSPVRSGGAELLQKSEVVISSPGLNPVRLLVQVSHSAMPQ